METLHVQFLKLSVYDSASDLEGFRVGLAALSRSWYDHDGRKKRLRVNFTRVMTDMLHLSRRTRVMPERDIVKYIRSAIAIDGVNLRFEPGFHVGRYLEEECSRFVQWQGVRSALSTDTVLAWSGMGTRMLTEAPAQAGNLMDRMARGDLAVRAYRASATDPDTETRSRALLLAAMVFSLVVLMVLTNQPVVFGWNLFTAEAGLVIWGLGSLAPILKRLVVPGLPGRT